MLDWLVISDDLTGACDTGAGFARAGLRTMVLLDSTRQVADADVQVISTESRHLAVDDASGAVTQALRSLQTSADMNIYKKIDSTLRGHPGVELSAVMRALEIDRAVVAPAFPGQGRTVTGGRVLVHGVPIEQTEFAQAGPGMDLLELFAPAGVVKLVPLEAVRRGARYVSDLMEKASPGIFIADAVEDADLERIAEAALLSGIRLFCGSAGLARALTGQPVVEPRTSPGMRGPVLVAAGSRSARTLQQVAAAERAGIRHLCLRADDLTEPVLSGALYRAALEALSRSADLVISGMGLAYRAGGEAQVADALAGIAAGLVRQGLPGSVVLTGGDTAAAFCRALECGVIELFDEVSPGVVFGRLVDGQAPGLPVITKAGGFGHEDTLMEALRFLSP